MQQGTFHPWRRMRDLGPDWKLRWSRDLPWDVYGFTDHASRTITLREGMTYAERRSTIAHEVEHALRGPVASHAVLAEELLIDRRVSRLLLPSMRDVCDALIYHHGCYEQTSDELAVDPLMLEVRLSALWAREREYLSRRLAEVELLAVDD